MNNQKNSVTRTVISYKGASLAEEKKDLVEEVYLLLYVNGKNVGEMICSPWEIREAVIGYLCMKEYIETASDVLSMDIDEDAQAVWIEVSENRSHTCSRKREVSAAAGEELSLTVEDVMELSQKLEEKSGLFHRTGGVHCAGFVRDGVFLSYKEDVSRHVAVDKVVGDCLLREIPMENGILVFSGRVPAEIMNKVAAMGCTVLIAKSAPTNYSCDLAQKLGITLIGFARDTGFNIYSHPERIIL